MRRPEIRYSSSPTYGGNDGHRISPCFEPTSHSVSFQPSDESGNQTSPLDRPEKKLTRFALRLARIRKLSNALDQVTFIWASVVLLGGFASALTIYDFRLVTIILFIECAHHFMGTSYSIWQHQRTPPTTTSYWVLVLKIIHHLRYYCQVFLAAFCATSLFWAARSFFWLMPLRRQNFREDAEINKNFALCVFYVLALGVSLVFLLETAYWKIKLRKLVEQVNKECGLGDIVSIRRFFNEAYCKCIAGRISDGLKMDLVSYAEELLDSDSLDKQIIGACMLKKFVENRGFAGNTLLKIESSTSVIERLIEMLNWKDPAEKDTRHAASVIVLKLASRKQNALRVSAIPGAMESIASLLDTGGGTADGRPYEMSPRAIMVDKEDYYEFSALNLLGLSILKRLARDHENCLKIGKAPGLLARIIDLTSSGVVLFSIDPAPELAIKTVCRALQVVKILVCTMEETWKTLRRDTSEIACLLNYIRELLQYGEGHRKLLLLGVEILTSLGMNEEEREKIGATGSMMHLILELFFRPIRTEEDETICNKLGEALAMLILESMRNCERMLSEKDDVVRRLVSALALGNTALRLNAARILRGLCAYSSSEQSSRL